MEGINENGDLETDLALKVRDGYRFPKPFRLLSELDPLHEIYRYKFKLLLNPYDSASCKKLIELMDDLKRDEKK